MIAKGYKFYMGLYSEIFRNLLVAKHKKYGFQFYGVLSQFPCIVSFGMKGFHVSASGAIQGYHGPLVKGYLLWLPWQTDFFMEHNY